MELRGLLEIHQVVVLTGSRLVQLPLFEFFQELVRGRVGRSDQEPPAGLQQQEAIIHTIDMLQHFKGDDHIEGLGAEAQAPPVAYIANERSRRVRVDAYDLANAAFSQIASDPAIPAADLQNYIVL